MDKLIKLAKVNMKMQKNRILFSYRGRISSEMSNALLSFTENKIQQLNGDNVKKRVFGIAVECIQNVADASKAESESVVIFAENNRGYVFHLGSCIPKNKAEFMKGRLSQITSLSSKDLDSEYSKLIRTEDHTNDVLLQLGVIDIVRKTGNPVSYYSKPIDNDNVFFSIMTEVNHQSRSHD